MVIAVLLGSGVVAAAVTASGDDGDDLDADNGFAGGVVTTTGTATTAIPTVTTPTTTPPATTPTTLGTGTGGGLGSSGTGDMAGGTGSGSGNLAETGGGSLLVPGAAVGAVGLVGRRLSARRRSR